MNTGNSEAGDETSGLPHLALESPLRSRFLTVADVGLVRDLFVRCEDYFQILTGAPPRENEALLLFEEGIPPEFDPGVRTIEGIWAGRKLVGLLDALRDYPDDRAWWLGLLLVDPAVRRSGIGRATVQAFEGRALDLEYDSVELGVVESNTSARAFWTALGYGETGVTRTVQFGDRTHRSLRMMKPLYPQSA